MPFGALNGVGRGMGVLDGGGDHRREGAVLGVNVGRPIVNTKDCGVVILCREGRRHGFSQITLKFLVSPCKKSASSARCGLLLRISIGYVTFVSVCLSVCLCVGHDR